jgi:hypothetical protein
VRTNMTKVTLLSTDRFVTFSYAYVIQRSTIFAA